MNWVTGSSYSDDGGMTWTDIEIGTQRTALGVHDINTMWAGGFTTSPSSDGIFRYEQLTMVACGDPSISSGVGSAPDSTICFGDTLFYVTNGAVPPSVGTTFGYSVIVSTADISFNNDPLSDPSVVGGTGVVYPAPASIPTTLINDGTIFPAGVYYFTPVVYGNATGVGSIFDLTLDPLCTYTGQSVMIELYALGDPACAVGINEIENNGLTINTYQSASGILQMNINSSKFRNLDVQIFDVTGRLAMSQKLSVTAGTSSNELNIASLNAGSYVIRVNDDSSASTVKFIKY